MTNFRFVQDVLALTVEQLLLADNVAMFWDLAIVLADDKFELNFTKLSTLQL